MPVTCAMITRTFFWPRTMARIGQAMSAGDKRRGRHLIEQRLEAMMVLRVDQRHVDRGVGAGSWSPSSPPKPAPTMTTRGRWLRLLHACLRPHRCAPA